eukprot:6210951-Pleurochrysis_carterae.AAC.1
MMFVYGGPFQLLSLERVAALRGAQSGGVLQGCRALHVRSGPGRGGGGGGRQARVGAGAAEATVGSSEGGWHWMHQRGALRGGLSP